MTLNFGPFSMNQNPQADPTNPEYYSARDDSFIRCCDAQRAMLGDDGYRAYLAGCAIKYLWRHPDKNGIEDLRKAVTIINMLVTDLVENGGPTD